ncbi:MAG: Flp pilus assembly complex ATPase component TadA, partial [Planctomycetes bacterium]|nr:Flp pilus assembly complex ATPase component TadA [Planctomycetota bacterium]
MIAAEAAEQRIVLKLLGDGSITPVGLASARRESELLGLPLLDVLQANDIVSETDLAQTYADLKGLRFLDLTRRSPNRAWVLTLEENVARRKNCLLFGEVSGQLVAAVADPFDPSVHAALCARFERPIQYVVSARYQIIEVIEEIYGQARAQGARIASSGPIATSVAPASATGLNMVEQFDSIIDEAVDRRASDIHIEPEADRLRIRLRIDGRLIEARAYPLDAASAMISRVKVLAKLDITERRKPQDGRFSHRSFDQEIDIRVAVIPP